MLGANILWRKIRTFVRQCTKANYFKFMIWRKGNCSTAFDHRIICKHLLLILNVYRNNNIESDANNPIVWIVCRCMAVLQCIVERVWVGFRGIVIGLYRPKQTLLTRRKFINSLISFYMVHTSLRSSDNAVPRLIHHLSLPTSNRT